VITENVVLREDDPRSGELQGKGWRVIARSWGARLDARDVDREQLGRLLERVRDVGGMREFKPSDSSAILVLDAGTAGDYPGGDATAHAPLDRERATVGPNRRGFGVISPNGVVFARTFVDVDGDGEKAETDFTVVATRWRGHGWALQSRRPLCLLCSGMVSSTSGLAVRPTTPRVWLRTARSATRSISPG